MVIFLFSTSVVLATGSVTEKIMNDSTSAIESETAVLDQMFNQPQLKEKYKQQLVDVFKLFSESEGSYEQLEESLLGLTVPTEYKDLHFSLVSAINSLNHNQSDPAKKNLERLKEAYGWLAANLSLFIANNF